MTFRPPATKTTRRRSRQTDSRRAAILNIAFALACVAALALLGSVVAGNYYADHGAPVASVNGAAISKDAVRARANTDLARANRVLDVYDQLRNQGKMTTIDMQQLTSTIPTDAATLYTNALNELTEELTLKQYADKHGTSVSDADVNAQIAKDATLAEARHLKVLAIQPDITPPNSVSTPSDNIAAQTKLQGYVDSIKSGAKKWDDVFTQMSKDAPTVASSGDMGIFTVDSSRLDPDITQAIFSLKNVGDITPVFKGSDGVYRAATITAIVPTYVDPGWQDAINSSGNGGDYRNEVTGEALKAKIQAQVEAQYLTGASTARHVDEILVSQGYSSPGAGNEVRARLIIFAPNHKTSDATTVAQTDAAWTDAKARADAAYAAVQKDPSQFSVVALDTKQNDDQFLASVGGELPWLPQSLYTGSAQSQAGLGMSTVPAQIFKPSTPVGLMAPILEPSMGWVLVDFQGSRPAADQRIADAQFALAAGTDFSTVAIKYSEAQDVGNGGDMGWVFKYQLSTDLEDAIFSAPIGGLTRVVSDSDGYHLYKVVAEETRTPDAAQQLTLKKTVFTSWLADLTNATNIWKDDAALTAITPTATP